VNDCWAEKRMANPPATMSASSTSAASSTSQPAAAIAPVDDHGTVTKPDRVAPYANLEYTVPAMEFVSGDNEISSYRRARAKHPVVLTPGLASSLGSNLRQSNSLDSDHKDKLATFSLPGLVSDAPKETVVCEWLASRVSTELKSLKPNDLSTALVHLYRGELGRQTAYRYRLDVTTNWSLTVGAALIGWAYTFTGVEGAFHLLLVMFTSLFWMIESRRYRYYYIVQQRVRLLEKGFYSGCILSGCINHAPLNDRYKGWELNLMYSYDTAIAPMSLVHAAVVRLRRIYIFIFFMTLMSWLVKCSLNNFSTGPHAVWIPCFLFLCVASPLPFVYKHHEDDV